MGLLTKGSLARQAAQALVCVVELETGRVGCSTGPFEVVVVLLVSGIANGLEEALVPRWSTHVLGGTGALTVHTGRVSLLFIRGHDLLGVDLMLPVVAEVVPIDERGAGGCHHSERDLLSIDEG